MSVSNTNTATRRSAIGDGFLRLMSDPMGAIGVVLVTLLILSAVFAGVLSPFDPAQINVPIKLQPPSWEHWLGTDRLGKDILAVMVEGTPKTIRIGLIAGCP